MPLLDKNQRVNATLANRSRAIAGRIAAAVSQANAIADDLLEMNDADLTSWLNSLPPAELEELFTAHATLGTALNSAMSTAVAVLSSSGLTPPNAVADVTPFAERITANGRTLTVDETTGSMTVTTD